MARSKTQQAAYDAELRSLKTRYRQLRNTANKRLARLETLAEKPEFTAVLGYAYKDAQYDIINKFGAGSMRYPSITDIEKMAGKETNVRKMNQYVTAVENFLGEVSSTRTGIVRTYKARADKLNKKYKTKFTWKDMAKFFESASYEKMTNKLKDSDIVMKVIAQMQKKPKQFLKGIEDARQNHEDIDIKALRDVDGLNLNAKINKEFQGEDLTILQNLVEMYAKK